MIQLDIYFRHIIEHHGSYDYQVDGESVTFPEGILHYGSILVEGKKEGYDLYAHFMKCSVSFLKDEVAVKNWILKEGIQSVLAGLDAEKDEELKIIYHPIIWQYGSEEKFYEELNRLKAELENK